MENIIKKIISKIKKSKKEDKIEEIKPNRNIKDIDFPSMVREMDIVDNNPNIEVALAMEIIIQFGNIWEDGFREMTPNMKQYLTSALKILNNYEEKDNRIVNFIGYGNSDLERFKVIDDDSKYEYIMYPIL